MRYLIVLSAPLRALHSGRFAVESSFGEHVRVLLRLLQPAFDEIVIAGPAMGDGQYETWRTSLTEIDPQERISFVPLYTKEKGALAFAGTELLPALRTLVRLVRDADLVHTHLSYDLKRPLEFAAGVMAKAMHKRVIAVTDMDNRRDTEMNHHFGRWGLRPYLTNRFLYDPLRDLQQRALVRLCDLVLFKEQTQVDDYGKGRDNVRLFLDPNFSIEHVASDDVVAQKVAELADPSTPLRAFYFGRLVTYKGVDKMIEAVAHARKKGAHLTFDIMGQGPERENLEALLKTHGIGDITHFVPSAPYGPLFFHALHQRHVLLACPLSADTPRSAWDAIASAMPLLAFDTPFYEGLRRSTGVVDVVPWPDAQALGDALVAMAADRTRLIAQVQRCTALARDNTGDAWLQRRVAWTRDLFA